VLDEILDHILSTTCSVNGRRWIAAGQPKDPIVGGPAGSKRRRF
jgi:hypothetical protein